MHPSVQDGSTITVLGPTEETTGPREPELPVRSVDLTHVEGPDGKDPSPPDLDP